MFAAALLALPHPRVGAGVGRTSRSCGKEVRQLQAQHAVAANARHERGGRARAPARRDLANALKSLAGPPSAAAPRARRPRRRDRRHATGRAAAPPAAARAAAGRPRLPRAVAPPPPSATTGIVRGKVEVPAGEPVAYVYVENILAPGGAAAKGHHRAGAQAVRALAGRWSSAGTPSSSPTWTTSITTCFRSARATPSTSGSTTRAATAKAHTFNEPGVGGHPLQHPPADGGQRAGGAQPATSPRSSPDGTFEIAGVPGGRRKVVAWAPGSRLTADWVEVGAGQTAERQPQARAQDAGHKNKNGQPYGSYE